MLRLTIKGNKKNATRAASRRRISVRNCSTKKGTTYCDTPCSKWRAVAEWYGEKTTGAKRGRGFVPGTLLFFSARDCD
jgi:hypothetical protein